MTTQSAVNLKITNNADGYDIAGGTTARKLTVTGADITLTGLGTAVMTFPSTSATIARTDAGQTFTGAQVMTSPTFTTSILPTTNDGCAIGAVTTGEFSDLFLAEGGVINWDNGDVTLTQTGNTLALAGGNLALGANNLTGTGTLSGTKATLGAASGTTGSIEIVGTTSGTVTLTTAAAAGTWTLTLPTTDGNANEFLQTNGSGVCTWAAGGSGGPVNPLDIQVFM